MKGRALGRADDFAVPEPVDELLLAFLGAYEESDLGRRPGRRLVHHVEAAGCEGVELLEERGAVIGAARRATPVTVGQW